MGKLFFASDYQEGAHPAVLRRLCETNLCKTPGYGADSFCETSRRKIREECACPGAAVHFLCGGTQANAVVIDAFLQPYQGVLAAESGHISSHEAGAIERGGHKVLTLGHRSGKISADSIREAYGRWRSDANRAHMVMPGMVYLSQPTEYGTLYTLSELTKISAACRDSGMPLYVDGARLAYALACPENDVALSDLARLCDVFYIGGTKCGALFGEAVVIPDGERMAHFFTIIKQHGALLAKGRLLGLQFDALFTGGLYKRLGVPAIQAAERLREGFSRLGFSLAVDSPTNQIFPVMDNDLIDRISEKAEFSFWEKYDETRSVVRFATSWATQPEDVDALLDLLGSYC